jgi:hypothetical protein
MTEELSTLAAGGMPGGADSGADTGAGGEPAGTGPQGAPPAQPQTGGAGAGWFTDYPEEMHATLGNYKTAEDAVKALHAAKQKITEVSAKHDGMLKVPGEDASDEEKAAYRKALGVPEDAAGYELPEVEVPEELGGVNAEAAEAYKAMALKHGLTPQQAAGLYADYLGMVGPQAVQQMADRAAASRQLQVDEFGKLRAEHGGKIKDVLANAQAAMQALGGDDLAEALGFEAGCKASVINAFARIAPHVVEGGIKGGGDAPQVTRAELNEMRRDPRYADPARRDPAYVAHVNKLMETVPPDENMRVIVGEDGKSGTGSIRL